MKHFLLITLAVGLLGACGTSDDDVSGQDLAPGEEISDSTNNADSNPADPTDPTTTIPDPADPADPADPTDPADPADPADPTDPVVDTLAEDLSYMRQEEKLAGDVYLTLGQTYSVRVFENIARSEQTHMDSILPLLEARALPDPVAGMDIGEFKDASFNTLYQDLVTRGLISQTDALEVGVDIEELDIHDLTIRIDSMPPADVVAVYEKLLSGSENHLNAFNGQLR